MLVGIRVSVDRLNLSFRDGLNIFRNSLKQGFNRQTEILSLHSHQMLADDRVQCLPSDFVVAMPRPKVCYGCLRPPTSFEVVLGDDTLADDGNDCCVR